MRLRPSIRISETTNGSSANALVEREASRIRAAIRFIVDSVVLFGRGGRSDRLATFFSEAGVIPTSCFYPHSHQAGPARENRVPRIAGGLPRDREAAANRQHEVVSGAHPSHEGRMMRWMSL